MVFVSVFSFILFMKLSHDVLLLVLIKYLVLTLSFFSFIKYTWVLRSWNCFKALYFFSIAVFMLWFHQGTLGFLFLSVNLTIIIFAICKIELVKVFTSVLILNVSVSFILVISSNSSKYSAQSGFFRFHLSPRVGSLIRDMYLMVMGKSSLLVMFLFIFHFNLYASDVLESDKSMLDICPFVMLMRVGSLLFRIKMLSLSNAL